MTFLHCTTVQERTNPGEIDNTLPQKQITNRKGIKKANFKAIISENGNCKFTKTCKCSHLMQL